MKNLWGRLEFRITLIYLVLGGLWIITSDELLAKLVQDPARQLIIQHYKGWFFVLMSALVIYFFLSVSQQKERKALAQQREYQELFQKIFETSMDAILLTIPDGRVSLANPAACKIFGQTEDEIIKAGRNGLVDLSSPQLPTLLEKRLRDGYASGELTYIRKDGSKFPGEMNSALFRDSQGIIRTTMIIRDITERKLAEQALLEYNDRLEREVQARTLELRQTQEALIQQEKMATFGQLAGGVAHELRNPLGILSNAAYYLKLILPDAEEKVKEYLEIMEHESQVANGIISDLLNYSSIQTGDLQKVQVAALIEDVMAKEPAPEGISVETLISKEIPEVYADPHQIHQALRRLVENAYQAMEGGGRLEISARKTRYADKKFALITIRDSGCGILPENLDRIFEPLFTTKARHIGLGLVISKRLIEVNGGSIVVKSQHERGTSVLLYLPVDM